MLRGLPDHLHLELKAAAERNNRSLSGEILARLAVSVQSAALDVDELLDRVSQRNASVGALDLSDASLRELQDTGRP